MSESKILKLSSFKKLYLLVILNKFRVNDRYFIKKRLKTRKKMQKKVKFKKDEGLLSK